MKMQKKKLVVAMALAAAVASPAAFATNGILQAGNGMVAHGMGGAGIANGAEASSGMDNPALISRTGTAANVAWSMFSPLRDMDATSLGGSEVTSDSNEFAIPQASFTVQANDMISWGVMAYAMGGMNTNYPIGMFGAQGSPETVNLQGLIVAPTISFAVNKDLSLGLAALIGKATLTTRNLFGDPLFVFSSGTIPSGLTGEDSSVGYGAKLGVAWTVTDWVSLGATYQSKMSMKEMDFFKNWLSGTLGFTGNAQLTLPDEYGIGAKWSIGKNVDILTDVYYYKWSGIDVFDFFGWEDQVVYKLGAEFRPTNAWALRVGYNYGKSPIKGGNTTQAIPNFGGATMDAAFANYAFPAISEQHFTLGVGYQLAKNTKVDAYYLYSPTNTEEASAGTIATPGFKVSMGQSAFGLGLNVTF